VKPANSGSSIGITKVGKKDDLKQAILVAQQYDSKVIIEEGLIHPKEIEVGVIGNKNLIISEPGELLLVKDFYDYQDKYEHNEAKVKIPADITEAQKETIKNLTEKVYRISECR
jgi:D-alanine-D-alanine ligase